MAVYKDKKTGKWYFRVYVTDPLTNKRVQRQRNGFELKRDAIAAEAELLSSYQDQSVILSDLNFNDLLDEYLVFQEKRVKPTTFAGYNYLINKHISPIFNNIKIKDINRLTLDDWYNYVNNLETSVNHKNKILTRLKNILAYCEDQYGLRVRYLNTFPPFKEVTKEDNKRVIYSEKTFKHFIKHASNQLESSLLTTMFYTGARIGEIRALTWKDINLKNNVIRVNKQVTNKIPGKGPTLMKPKTQSSVRDIQIPNILVDTLTAWKANRKSIHGFKNDWLVFGDRNFISENTVRRFVKKISKKANTPYITLHGFRHSYTTMLYTKNVDPKIMQAQAGHSSINVTLDTYTHIQQEIAKKTIIDIFEDEED